MYYTLWRTPAEEIPMSVTERSSPRQQARDDSRQPEFVVRAKTGPGRKEWATIGYAWRRERGEGFSIKLNTMPIGKSKDDDDDDADQQADEQGTVRRKRAGRRRGASLGRE